MPETVAPNRSARDAVKRHFRAEAAELLETISAGLLAIERGDAPKNAVALLFRAAHTLKGGARVVGKTTTAEAAHMIEDALALHREQGTLPGGAEVSDFLRLVDTISRDLAEEEPADPARPDQETTRIDIETIDAFTEALFEAENRMGGLRAAEAAMRHAARVASRIRAQLATGTSPQAVATAMEDLESLLAASARQSADALESASLGFGEARAHADDMRLLPVRTIFSPLERAVRDAGHALGKKTSFQASGGDARLDGHVLHEVKEALLHVVRNAVAHGIESPEQRTEAGKPETGTVRLHVERRGGRVVFHCSDDGAGIDIDAVKRRALEAGATTRETLARLSEREVLDLALSAGVSTAAQVTEWSGRGVGMDVVRSVARRCKGEVQLQSRLHEGTTVSLEVSVSLSTVHVLGVLAHERKVLLPIEAVLRTVRASAAELVAERDGRSLVVDGEVVPFLELAQALGDTSPSTDARWSVVVLRQGERKVAVGTSGLVGTSEVALRRLPDEAGASPLVAGAAIDASGEPILVLEAAGLVDRVSHARFAPGPPRRRPLPVLVIDDSLTTRMLEQSILEGAGYRVELASSAEEALEKAATQTYSLFVVDAEMPGMSGFEFVAATRQHETLKKTPVMMVTSLGSAEHRARGMQQGASAYIVKGAFDQSFFLTKVTELAGAP
jgi:two-component system chemotaxis sensor kinase CheA